jgi:hypothetical protein
MSSAGQWPTSWPISRCTTTHRPETQSLYKQHSARGYNAAEPFRLSEEPPSLIGDAITAHLVDREYTSDELAEAVLLTPHEFRRDLMGETTLGRAANVVDLF